MSDDKMQATGLYVVRLVHRLKDGQYYVERHEVFAPITDIGRYHTGAVHDCKGPLDWDSAKDWLRTYTVPIGFDEVSRDLGVRQEIYYIRNKDFEEYRQWLCDTKQEIISRDDLIKEILTKLGSIPVTEG